MNRIFAGIVSLLIVVGFIFTAFFVMETRHASAGRVTYLECSAWTQERNRKEDDNYKLSDRYEAKPMPSETLKRYRNNKRDIEDLQKLLDAQCSLLKKGR